MAKTQTPEVVKVATKSEGTVKVKLKCNYDLADKDGKIVAKKPDEVITLPAEKADKLIANAWAVKA